MSIEAYRRLSEALAAGGDAIPPAQEAVRQPRRADARAVADPNSPQAAGGSGFSSRGAVRRVTCGQRTAQSIVRRVWVGRKDEVPDACKEKPARRHRRPVRMSGLWPVQIGVCSSALPTTPVAHISPQVTCSATCSRAISCPEASGMPCLTVENRSRPAPRTARLPERGRRAGRSMTEGKRSGSEESGFGSRRINGRTECSTEAI